MEMLGLEARTKSVPPTFPLFFHERLKFERVSPIVLFVFVAKFCEKGKRNSSKYKLSNMYKRICYTRDIIILQ